MKLSRKMQYESGGNGNTLDDLSKKMAGDLRKHVRKLDAYPVLSKEWIDMKESLLHISNIAVMESGVPKESEDSTLWEGDEMTVRFLLEEGKLNLCLRLMHQYKTYQRQLQSSPSIAQKHKDQLNVNDEALEGILQGFEQSLGTLLRCAFEHVEAVQTIDLPELLQHVAEVLSWSSSSSPGGDLERLQEAQCCVYMHSLMQRVADETFPESKVLPLLLDNSVFSLMVQWLNAAVDKLPADAKLAGLRFLSLVCDSEEFGTHPGQFLEGCKKQLKDCQPWVTEMSKESAVRRSLQPLLDNLRNI